MSETEQVVSFWSISASTDQIDILDDKFQFQQRFHFTLSEKHEIIGCSCLSYDPVIDEEFVNKPST